MKGLLEAVHALKETAVETTTVITGFNIFLRELSAELRSADPAMMDRVIKRIESTDTLLLDTESQIKGKAYALTISRSV